MSAPMMGVKLPNGALNGRRCWGWVFRSTMMPRHTITNASSVPMLTSWPAAAMVVVPAKMAMMTPVTMVVMWGVRYFGWTFANTGGSRPSLAMAQNTRGWLMSMTSMADDSAPMAAMPI